MGADGRFHRLFLCHDIPVSDTERRMNTAARVNSLPEELVLDYELTFSPFPFRLHRDHQFILRRAA